MGRHPFVVPSYELSNGMEYTAVADYVYKISGLTLATLVNLTVS